MDDVRSALRLVVLPMLGLALLAGCSDRPMSANAEPQGSAFHFVRPPSPKVEGSLVVSTLPVDALAPADGDLVNCMYVGEDTSELTAVTSGTIRLDWVAESSSTATLTIVASNGEAASASATGSSPLWLNWTADSSGPLLLPFSVDVTAAGSPGLAIRQSSHFDIALDADAPDLEAIQGSC